MAEMNSIMFSVELGVSDAFEAALWVSDILFEYANLGMVGVNLHTNIWNTIHGWDIYGAFLFNVPENQYLASSTEAKPPAGYQFTEDYELRKVLPVKLETSANMKAGSTLDPKTGNTRIVIINKDQDASGKVTLNVPGYTSGRVKRLQAPSLSAQEGITYGGQAFDGSKDGKPVGQESTETVQAESGRFEVEVSPVSAFLLTLGNSPIYLKVHPLLEP